MAINILAIIAALTATVLAFIFIVPSKKRAGMNKFGKFLHDTLNFKYLIIEKILQAAYIFFTAYVILIGFFALFYVQEVPGSYVYDPVEGYGHYTTSSVWYGGQGLLVMILGPIVIRVAYEMSIMLVLLVKNVIQINNKLKSDGETKDVFAVPTRKTFAEESATPVAPAPAAEPDVMTKVDDLLAELGTPAEPICVNCGAKLKEDAKFCAKCGTKV